MLSRRGRIGKRGALAAKGTGVWPRSNLSSGGEFDFEIIGVVEAVPAFVPTVAFEGQAQVQDAGGSGLGPEHPRLFEALADDGFAAALHHA